MLNMNVYKKKKRKELSLFQFGWDVLFGGCAINRYTTGQYRIKVTFLTLFSPGTGHFPFTVFSYDCLTGDLFASQLCILGLTIGSKMVHNIDEDTGTIHGPDYRKYYWYFSCLNHQYKLVEEII